jgi:hypothetical protein
VMKTLPSDTSKHALVKGRGRYLADWPVAEMCSYVRIPCSGVVVRGIVS